MNLLDRKRLSENIDGIAECDFSNNKVFGAAYLVSQDSIVLEKCYGTEGLHSNTPITNSSVFHEDSYPYLPKGSFGWSGAYGSHFGIDPPNKMFAVFMKNSKYDGGAGNESARNFEKAVYSSF